MKTKEQIIAVVIVGGIGLLTILAITKKSTNTYTNYTEPVATGMVYPIPGGGNPMTQQGLRGNPITSLNSPFLPGYSGA